MARDLNGSSQSLSVAVDLSSVSTVTIAYWVNIDAYSGSFNMFHEFTADGGANAGGFQLFRASSSSRIFCQTLGDVGLNGRSYAQPSTGMHHICCVYDYTQNGASGNEGVCYVDGVEPSVATSQTNNNTGAFANSTLYIGARTNSTLWFNGQYNDVALWEGTALSTDEITALSKGASPLLVTKPSRYWRLTGNGSTEVDVLGGSPLTLTGSPAAAQSRLISLGGAWPVNYTPAAGGGATGTSTQNLPSLTQSATGQQPHTGTAAQSLPSLSQAATGAQPFEGSAAQTLPATTQVGTGLAGSSAGTSVQTLPAATQSGVGIMQPSATAAQTLPAATQSGTGEQTMAGTAAQTLPATQQAGAGTHGNVHTGAAAQTLPAATQAGTGEQPHAGTGTQTLPSAQQAGAGAQAGAGTAAQTLPATTQSGTGTMHPFVVAVQILPSLTQVATATSATTGAGIPIGRTLTMQASDRTLTMQASDRTLTLQ